MCVELQSLLPLWTRLSPGNLTQGFLLPALSGEQEQTHGGGQLLSEFCLGRSPMMLLQSETTTENLSGGLASWGIS